MVFGPLTIAGLRVAGGAVVLALLAWALGRWQWPSRHQLKVLTIVIVIGYAVPYTIQPIIVPICGSGFVGMIVGFVPLMTVLVSMPLLRVYPNRGQYIGVIGGLLCLFLVIGDGLQRSFSAWYLLLGVLVPTLYACSNTIIKKSLADVPPLISSTWCLFGAAVPLLPLGLATETMQTDGDLLVPIVSVLILGCVGTGLVMFAFYQLITAKGPLYAGLVAYVIPIGAVMIGALDGEEISVLQGLAMLGIIAMVIWVQVSISRQMRTDQIGVDAGAA